jgi:hypothetical protein
MLHVALYASGMKRFVMAQVVQIQRIVLKVSLEQFVNWRKAH